MAKEIEGTEDFTGGSMFRPDGSDDGNEFSALVTDFMERMAVHDHSGEASKNIFLPPSVEDKFLVPTFVTDGIDRVKTTLTMTKGTTVLKSPVFYFKEQADPDQQENWFRFYPSYDVDAVNPQIVTLRKLLSSTISIKAIS
jgi:hypothetical protein